MKENVKVSGCIVTYNNANIIEACIESLLKNTKGVEFKLFISDNGSTDGTPELIRNRFPEVMVLTNKENLGFGGGHNQAIPFIDDSQYHFVINPDIYIDKDVITVLVEYLENHSEVAMITPKIMNDNGTEQLLPKRNPSIRYLFLSKFKPFKYYRSIYTRENEILDKPTSIEFCTGCFFGIRSNIFNNIHGFDERYFMYMEDADISRTVGEKYKIIFFPDIYVYHKWHRENLKNFRGIKRWMFSMFKYFSKWGWKF